MERLIDRTKIGVLGLSDEAGCGFLCASLARGLAEQGGYHPAVLELGTGGLYDRLGLAKRFAGRSFFDFWNAIANDRSIRGHSNELNGVNWMVRIPGEPVNSMDLLRTIRWINHALGDVILCKLSGLERENLWKLLYEMDRVIVVVDPLPSSLLSGYQLLCDLRNAGLPITYVVNKYNGGIDRKQVIQFLQVQKLNYMPLIPLEAIYRAEYTCQILYDLPEVKGLLEGPLEQLRRDIFL